MGNKFKNQTSKKRATDKAEQTLPFSSYEKANVLETLANSPRTRKALKKRGLIKSLGEQKETSTLKALASDISQGLKVVRHSGSHEKSAAFRAFPGENKRRGLKSPQENWSINNERSISKAIKNRESILKGNLAVH